MTKIKYGDVISHLEVVDLASDGKAVAKKEGMVVFLTNAVPGDIVDVKMTKSRRKYYEGVPVHFYELSKDRIEPKCSHFGVCGGCKWQHLDYGKQLFYKEKQVFDNLTRIAKVPVNHIFPIIPSENVFYYRNKLEFTFTNKRWLTEAEMGEPYEKNMNALGFHVPNQFSKVVNIDKCYLMHEKVDDIRNSVREFALENNMSFFDLKSQEGFLRNIIIRSTLTGEWMVIVVFAFEDLTPQKLLLDFIAEKFPEITSLMYVINSKRNDTIGDLDVNLYKGNAYMIEAMETLRFKISPQSFFQTNMHQAYKLYCVVRDFAALNGHELVYDLYTGTGTIALFIANNASKVVGLEYVEKAIEDAKENASLNNINNTLFFAGAIEKIMDEAFIHQHGKPEIIITDPPRAGMHQNVIEQLLKVEAKKIVYVSCNPATQARDIELLSEKYVVEKVQAVDMFPHTAHVESVALLILK